MRVSVGDVELYVHERGEGRPLVALHVPLSLGVEPLSFKNRLA